MRRIAAAMFVALLVVSPSRMIAQATPEQILDRYARLVDPHGRLPSTEGVRIEARMVAPGTGIKAKLTMLSRRPGMERVTIESPRADPATQGFDGTIGWQSQGGDHVVLPPEPMNQLRRGPLLDWIAGRGDRVARVEAAGERRVFRELADCLARTWVDGSIRTECYSRRTGLLVESIRLLPRPDGEVVEWTYYEKYTRFDGILLARSVTVKTAEQTQLITLTKVEFGPIDSSLFKPPSPLRYP